MIFKMLIGLPLGLYSGGLVNNVSVSLVSFLPLKVTLTHPDTRDSAELYSTFTALTFVFHNSY